MPTNLQLELGNAVLEGEIEKIRELLQQGAMINQGSVHTPPPLLIAGRKSSPELTHFLLCNGAQVDCRDRDANTPLHLTCRWIEGYDSLEQIRLLLEHRSEINALNSLNQGVLELVLIGYNSHENLSRNPKLTNLLWEVLTYLLNCGARVTSTTFPQAVLTQHPAILKLLLKNCPGNKQNLEEGCKLACVSGNMEMILPFFHSGFQPTEGLLELILSLQNSNLLELLLSYGGKFASEFNVLGSCCRHRNQDIEFMNLNLWELLFKYEILQHTLDHFSIEDILCELLTEEAFTEQVELIMRNLKRLKFDMISLTRVVNIAVNYNNPAGLEVLLRFGVNPDNTDLEVSPLYLASKLERAIIFDLLLEYGAKLERNKLKHYFSGLYFKALCKKLTD